MISSSTIRRFAVLVPALLVAGIAQAADTLSLDEVKTAATAKFAKLDTDGDGTLEPAEMKSVFGDRGFTGADTNADGKLDKTEYLAWVERLFKRADVDNDGSVDTKELNGPNGKMLKRLLR